VNRIVGGAVGGVVGGFHQVAKDFRQRREDGDFQDARTLPEPAGPRGETPVASGYNRVVRDLAGDRHGSAPLGTVQPGDLTLSQETALEAKYRAYCARSPTPPSCR
jgi:hypothetical protein